MDDLQMKIRMMGTRKLINEMHICYSNDREFALEGCESISRRVRFLPTRSSNLRLINELSCVDVLIDLYKVWEGDVAVAACAARAMWMIARRSDLAADRVIELGGLALAENTETDDEEVRKATDRLVQVLTQRSRGVAEREIKICQVCAVNNVDMRCAAELGRIMSNEVDVEDCLFTTTRRPADLSGIAKQVLNHMQSHTRCRRVQNVGFDALTEVCRSNVDVESALLSFGASKVIVDAMRAHEKSFQIQWKACLAISLMAKQRRSLSSDLGKCGAVKALKCTINEFRGDREVRQQAFWALAALCNLHKNVERMHHEHILICVVNSLYRHESPQSPIDQQVALPMRLRNIWNDTEFDEAIQEATSTCKKGRNDGQTITKRGQAQNETQQLLVAGTLNQVARGGKGRFNRVSDSFAHGVSGLVD